MTFVASPALHRELINAFGAMDDAVLVTDSDGKVVFANEAMARLLGASADAVPPLDGWTERVRLWDAAGHPLGFDVLPERRAREGQAPPPVELVWQTRATGQERWLSATSRPMGAEAGQPGRVLTVFRDVTVVRRATQAMRFLAEASATLATSLDHEATLEMLARLTVPALADWCSVDVLEPDGNCRQRGVAHIDPSKVELTRELRRRNPLRIDSPTGPAQVLRTGKPLLVPIFPLERLKAITKDPEDLRLLVELGLKSSITVPLIARGRTLGILGLYTAERGRVFDEEDLALAQELANRAALAVDNARLFQSSRTALVRKDEEARLNETLMRLGNAFASELDPARLAQLVADEATSMLGARHGAFSFRFGSGEGEPVHHVFAGDPDDAFARRTRAWVPQLLGGGFGPLPVLRSDDAARDPRCAMPGATEGLEGTPSVLAAPISTRSGAAVGVLSFADVLPGTFTAHHERALQGIAAQAAVALDNAHLFRQLREAKERIRESEGRLRIAMAAGQMGYFEMEVLSRRVALAPRFEAMLGLPPDTFDGSHRTIQKYLHPEDVQRTREWILQMLQQRNEGGVFVFRAIHPGGAVHWIETYSQLVRDDEGHPVRLLGIGMDVTDRYEAQEQVRRLVEELKRSNEELEQFAYVASHDLQEPLRIVGSYTQLLARRYRGKLDSDADEFIAYAVDGVGRMKNLINDLLKYSRVGTRTRPSARVALEDVLGRVLVMLQPLVEECQATITKDAGFPVVIGDDGQLEQLLQNLLTNALKFRGERPAHVHVGVEAREGEWVISVRDNGIGIDPQYFQRIFVIFQRLHTQEAYPGTGIGLAVCKRIVERHGGRIWVESTPGQGATFFFSLPAQAQAQAQAQAVA